MGRYDSADEVAMGGDRIQFSKHLGALVCIRPTEVAYKEFDKEDKETGEKIKEKVLTVIADVDIIEGGYLPASKKAQGERFNGVWISGAVLAKSLKEKIGKEVLGRVAEGEKGRAPQPPIILEPFTDDDAALADAFYAAIEAGEAPAKSEAKGKDQNTKPKAGKEKAKDKKSKELTEEQKAKIAAIMGEDS